MTKLTDKSYAVEVPEGAQLLHTEVDMNEMPYLAYKFKDDELLNDYELIYLQPGLWRFLFTTKTATEEDARKVVEKEELFINGISQGMLYCNYFVPHDVCEWYKQATDSLLSLLRSKGLDPNKNYALIEKQSSDE